MSPKITVVLFSEASVVSVAGNSPHALTPLHGRPLMDWVVESFRATNLVGNLVLVAPEQASQTAGFRYVSHHIRPPKTLQWPLFEATLRRVLFSKPLSNNPCLLATLDAAWLKPKPLRQMLESFRGLTEAGERPVHLAATQLQENTSLPEVFAEQLAPFPPQAQGGKANPNPNDNNQPITTAPFTYCVRGKLLARLRRPWSQSWPQDNPKPFSDLCKPWEFERLNQGLPPKKRLQWGFARTDDESFFKRVLDSQTLEVAERALPSPWKNARKKVMVIANPNAGLGPKLSPFFRSLLGIKTPHANKTQNQSHAHSTLSDIQKTLEDCGLEVQTTLTNSPSEATSLAKQCTQEGIDIVVAAGGDGSINGVVNGLAGSNVSLGVVPMGTTNVYGLQMNLPTNPIAACHVIASGTSHKIDLGLMDDRYFVCMAGIGFDAHVVQQSSSKLKKRLGPFAYLLVGLRELFRYRFKSIKVQIDEQPITRKGLSLFIGNGKYYGGHFLMTPKATMNDGYLDVCIMRRKNVLNIMGYVRAIVKGNIQSNLNVEYFQFKSLRLPEGNKKDIRAQVDGDVVSSRPKKVQVVSSSLRIIV